MIKVRDKTYRGETVILDHREFIGCTFLDCVFKWNGGPTKFGDGTAFGGFRGFISDVQQIADTVSLLKGFGLLLPEFATNWQRATPHYVPVMMPVIDARAKPSRMI